MKFVSNTHTHTQTLHFRTTDIIMLIPNDKHILLGLRYYFSGLATIIATAVFGVYFTLDPSVLSWAFMLACTSGGIQILTGLITLFVVPCAHA